MLKHNHGAHGGAAHLQNGTASSGGFAAHGHAKPLGTRLCRRSEHLKRIVRLLSEGASSVQAHVGNHILQASARVHGERHKPSRKYSTWEGG